MLKKKINPCKNQYKFLFPLTRAGMVGPQGSGWRQREELNDSIFRASPPTVPSITAGL